MNDKDWCKACRDVADAHATQTVFTVASLRQVLARLDRLMRDAPWTVRGRYAELPEAELAKEAEDHAARIEMATLAWPKRPIGNAPSLRSLAVQIRAVDHLLGTVDPYYNELPVDPRTAWLTRDPDAYVIPTRRPRSLGSAAGDRLGYSRRGTVKHRVIPTEIAGLPVRVIAMGDLDTAPATDPIRLGAATWPGLTLVPEPTDRGFVAIGLDHPAYHATLRHQIESLCVADAIVWPELTVDPAGVTAIEDELRWHALGRAGSPPAVVVAGSWHVGEHTPRQNLAPILDGFGEHRANYVKIVPFHHATLGWEDIASGGEIVVLACDRFLASVAICKDYCDMGEQPPWSALDVDLMLVPSMGGVVTMDGHLHRARESAIHQDQRALVAQQTDIPAGRPAGYVLGAPRKPPIDASALATDAEFLLFDFSD